MNGTRLSHLTLTRRAGEGDVPAGAVLAAEGNVTARLFGQGSCRAAKARNSSTQAGGREP
jgi:hypothetical protein